MAWLNPGGPGRPGATPLIPTRGPGPPSFAGEGLELEGGPPVTAPLAASLSIPSSLDRDRLTMTAPDEQEVRLREARRERARCPECGKLGVLEVLTVHRPGLPSVRRTVIRCTRTARKDPRGRELAAGHRARRG